MAYPNLSEKETEDMTIELKEIGGEEKEQIGFEWLKDKATTPTSGSEASQLLTDDDQPQKRPRLSTAERVSIFNYSFMAHLHVDG